MNILLTSSGRRTYLVEYFKSALNGVGKVFAANSRPCPAFSFADEWTITPEIYDPHYISYLLDYCVDNEIEAVIPLFDIDIPVLSNNKDLFERQGTTVIVPEPEIARACNDKLETARLLQSKGISVPKTTDSIAEAIEQVRSGTLSFPLVVKPRWGMGSIGVHIARGLAALEAACVLIKDEIDSSYLRFETGRGEGSPYIIQEMVRGDEYGLDVICNLRSEYVMTSVKRKVGMRAGETDSAVTVDSQELRELGSRLSAVLPHPGVMDIDVIRSENGPVVLEANARFGGGYPFTHVSGIDVPSIIVGWLSGHDVKREELVQQIGCFAYKDISMRVGNCPSK